MYYKTCALAKKQYSTVPKIRKYIKAVKNIKKEHVNYSDRTPLVYFWAQYEPNHNSGLSLT